MFDDVSGRIARNEDEAEEFIWKFIAENLVQTERHIVEHNRDYDLYLPWLLEIVSNLNVPSDHHAMPIYDLEIIYMNAAWSMVMKGYLRPGPRAITGDSRDGAGKGYSLTAKGHRHIASLLNTSRAAVTAV